MKGTNTVCFSPLTVIKVTLESLKGVSQYVYFAYSQSLVHWSFDQSTFFRADFRSIIVDHNKLWQIQSRFPDTTKLSCSMKLYGNTNPKARCYASYVWAFKQLGRPWGPYALPPAHNWITFSESSLRTDHINVSILIYIFEPTYLHISIFRFFLYIHIFHLHTMYTRAYIHMRSTLHMNVALHIYVSRVNWTHHMYMCIYTHTACTIIVCSIYA
jgi:hypothetical protein